MRKRNIYKEYEYNNSYHNSYKNRITVNKNSNINNKNLTTNNDNNNNNNNININNYKDNLYYENKNKNKRNKLSEEKTNNNKIIYYKETYKKTINTYSNENKIKDRNIFEELQNNKYLRPMLGKNNINKKLLKCKIEEPIKNICTLSLRNYFANMELPFQKNKSPQKRNIICKYDEDNIYSINFNNRTVMDRFNININNGYSPINANLENKTFESNKDNSNSFIYNGNNNFFRYSVNNIKKFSANQLGRLKNEKYFYYEKKKEKDYYNLDNIKSPKIYHKNVITFRGPFNDYNKDTYTKNSNFNNNIKNQNIYNNKNNNGQKDKILLNIYKNKLVEEFIIVLNKFIVKYFNKIYHFFINKLINFKNNSKVYFKKKNSRINIKKLTLNENNTDIKLLINLQKNKSKIINDTLTNFNSKSFSNEFKSSSLTSNFRSNNNLLNKPNDSFIQSEQKYKIFYQSPEDSLNKFPQKKIRQKIIVQPKNSSGSQNKKYSKSPNKFELNDIFVYKKKNMNNDNLYINKNNKINNLSNINLNINKTNNIITNNKKGKIIDIDINLGKPVSIINDHSPLEELFINSNNQKLFQINTISSKFNKNNNNNNKKKKKKANSGSKNKIKPPLKIKKFVEEDDDDEDDEDELNNNYIDNKTNTSMRKDKNINIRKYIDNNIFENEKNKNHKEKIEKKSKKHIFIRFNHFSIYNNNNNDNIKIGKEKYKYLIKKNDISIFIKNDNKKNNKEIKNDSSKAIKNIKKRKKPSNLYINCTKFLVKIFNKIIKKKIYISIYNYSKNK